MFNTITPLCLILGGGGGGGRGDQILNFGKKTPEVYLIIIRD